MYKEIKVLTKEGFGKYGVILETKHNKNEERHFEVFVTAESSGWRMGLLELVRNEIPYMERHLKTKEGHEPVEGTTILLVSMPENPGDIEVFLLDKPVCLHEGIWHQVMAASERALVRITENISVPHYESEVFLFEKSIRLLASVKMKSGTIKVPEQ